MNKFSAIVFHQRNCYKDDLPGKRTPEQRYVMFMLESADYPFSFVGCVNVVAVACKSAFLGLTSKSV